MEDTMDRCSCVFLTSAIICHLFFLSQIAAFLFILCHCFVCGLVNLFLFSGFGAHCSSCFWQREANHWPVALTSTCPVDIRVGASEVLKWDREATRKPCKMMCAEVQAEIHPVFLRQNWGCAPVQKQRRDPDNGREELNGWRRYHLKKLLCTELQGLFLTDQVLSSYACEVLLSRCV